MVQGLEFTNGSSCTSFEIAELQKLFQVYIVLPLPLLRAHKTPTL